MRICAAAALMAVLTLSACNGSDEAEPTPSSRPGSPAVGIELTSAAPQYPRGTPPELDMVARNDGDAMCLLPSSAVGTVDVVSVTRDGQAVIGGQGHAYYFGGIGDVVAKSLEDAPPGTSVTAPLDIKATANSAAVLVVSQQSAGDDARLTTWKLDQPGRYKVTARLVPVAGVDRMCPAPPTTASVEFEVTQ